MPPIHLPTTLVKDVTLDELDAETLATVRAEDMTALRAEWFPRMAASIEDGPEIHIDAKPAGSCGAALREWAKRMTAQTGRDQVTVWRTPVPWLAALAVVLYGEAPAWPQEDGTWRRIWPEAWTPAAVERALRWESGVDIPGAVTGRAVVMPGSRLSVVAATLS